MGSIIAIREGMPLVPNTPSSSAELRAEVRRYADMLDVHGTLAAYGSALDITQPKKGDYFLLELRPPFRGGGNLTIKGYQRDNFARANEDYMQAERSLEGIEGAQAVLVSVEALKSLRLAFPNYFLDTHKFIDVLDEALA